MRIIKLTPGGHVDELFNEVLAPSFPPEELCSLEDLQTMIIEGHPTLIALDDDDRVIGGAVGEWEPEPRVMLLSWLAIRPGIRGGGIGGALLSAATEAWSTDFAPCIVIAEVEDPAAHKGSEATGDPVARLRFYQRRGARALDMPYFQASLGEGLPRVPDLLLMVLHTEPQFAGTQPDTIDPAILRRYLELYQIQGEGQIATDEQAMTMWRALDAFPAGVPILAASPDAASAPAAG
jgi:GNAT superfamily N-acetyltransferase